MLALRWGQSRKRRTAGAKPFKLEAMWLRDPRCANIVSDAWEYGLCISTGHPLQNCISSCSARLTQWNKREFGHVGHPIKTLRNKLQILEASETQHGQYSASQAGTKFLARHGRGNVEAKVSKQLFEGGR